MENWVSWFIPLALGLLAVGVVFWVIGFFQTKKTKEWVHTNGEVSRIGNNKKQVTVRFETEEGEIEEFTTSLKHGIETAVGSTVPVLYDPFYPSQAVIHSFVKSGRAFFTLGTMCIGTAMGALLVIWAIF